MKLSLLFLTRSGKSNWNRLGLTVAAVALGTLMLLVFAAGLNGLSSRATHSQWRNDIFMADKGMQPIDGVAPLKADVGTGGNLNKWHNEKITTVSLRATDDTSPQIPGLPTPREGEYYVSAGLDKVMREHPEENIGSRFGNKKIGVLSEELATSPDALEVVRGMNEKEANNKLAVSVYKFTKTEGGSMAKMYSGMVGVIMAVGGAILFVPIILFISIATQLGSAQREKRYAALRLIGATRRQVSRIMAVESLAAAITGVVIGSLAYLAVLPLMSQYEFNGMRFYASDITVPFSQYILVVALTLLFCLMANWWGMRRVQLSPLGVARSSKPGKRPRAWRLLLLLPGLALFAWLSTPMGTKWLQDSSTGDSANTVLALMMLGIMSVMFGLLLAGPWLTSSVSRLIARRTRKATTLLAGKRIATQSKRVFRSVSGVVLALFAGSFYLTSVSGIAEYSAKAVDNNGYSQLQDNTAIVISDVLPGDFEAKLKQQSYVQSVAVAPVDNDDNTIVSCKTLEEYTRTNCPAGSKPSDTTTLNFHAKVTETTKVLPDAPTATNTSYLVRLGTNDNLDKLRSFVANAAGIGTSTWVVSGTYAQIPIINPIIPELSNLAYAGMGITLFVAIASLIVSTIGGLLERKRSFATLRLGGMTVDQMKHTVVIESLIPLISVSVIACGLGIWIGALFILVMSDSVHPTLTPLYFAIVLGALIIATISIRVIAPMIGRITRPEENQTE